MTLQSKLWEDISEQLKLGTAWFELLTFWCLDHWTPNATANTLGGKDQVGPCMTANIWLTREKRRLNLLCPMCSPSGLRYSFTLWCPRSNAISDEGIVSYTFLSITSVIHKDATAENELQRSTSGGVDWRVSGLWESSALAPGPEQYLLLKSKKVKFTTGALQTTHHEKRLTHAQASNMISQ